MRYSALATDYDGTIAEHGVVSPSTVDALQRFRRAGGELILATGREVGDLQEIFPELNVFHWIAAENGAVLFHTATQEEILLADRPSDLFIQRLRDKGVSPLYIGRVIVASFEDQLLPMQEAIRELALEHQVIPNKGAAMILPLGCDKGSGMNALFERTGISAVTTIGVGDAENDIPLLKACGLGVALANALPCLKDRADWIMSKPAGEGVAELIDRVLTLTSA